MTVRTPHLEFVLNFYKIFHALGTTWYSQCCSKFVTTAIIIGYFLINVFLIGFTLFGNKYISLPSQTSVQILTDYLQTALPIFCHLVIVIETIVKRDCDRKIIARILHIERLVRYYELGRLRFERNYFIIFGAFMFLGSGIEVAVISILKQNLVQIWRFSISIRCLAYIVGRLMLMQFILLITYIKYKFFYLEMDLAEAIGEVDVNLFRKVRKIYTHLWELLEDINKRFGYSIMALLLYLFFTEVASIYWICLRIRFRNFNFITASSLTAIPPTMTLIVLYVYAQSFNDQMLSFKTKLHSIFQRVLNDKEHRAHNLKTLRMINLISMGVLQMKLTLNICGCIVLGYDQFQEVLASLIQYLFIFISFSGF